MLGVFFIYLLKSAVCLLVFSLFFRLLLLSDTFVRFSRAVLLFGILLCLLLPFVKLHLEKETVYQQPMQYVEDFFTTEEQQQIATNIQLLEEPVNNEILVNTDQEKQLLHPIFWILLVYGIGVVFMLGRLLFSFYNLWHIVRKGKSANVGGQRFIISKRPITAFSFFGIIVLSQKDYEDNPEAIITHEQMHSRYWHSLDAIFIELVLILQWFNVGLWSLRSDLRALHEYEADRGVIREGIDATRYQMLLIKKAVGERCFTSVANSFNHSLIKNRITMMLKKKTNPWARLKVLLMLPLAVGMLYAFAQPAVEKIMDTVQQDIVEVVDVSEETIAMRVWKRIVEREPSKKQERNFLKTIQRKQAHSVLINKYNQLMYNGVKFPANFPIEKVAKIVEKDFYEKWKHFNQLGEEYKPQLFNLQSDRATDSKAIVRVTDALVQGYEQALTTIAKELILTNAEFSEVCPLLLVYNNSFILPPPPAKEHKSMTLDEIEEVKTEKPKQCYIEALSSETEGMTIAANFPIEILREFLNPVRNSLSNIALFSMYLGEGNKVKKGKLTELKKLLRLNSISKVNHIVKPKLLPLKKVIPTSSDLEKWQDAAMYGIWIDAERITNEELVQYESSDFSHYFVSKLHKNAKNYGKHYYQVDLMTNAYYKAYLKRKLAEDKNNMPKGLPLEKSAIKSTAEYGMRVHPVFQIKKMHEGIDFSAAEGTPVFAPADGIVTNLLFNDKGHGNRIVIKHNDKYQTRYSHLQKIKVAEGQRVKKGQLIGTVGSTGISTAPHLHYEVVRDNETVNPRNYFSME